jgi:hypothetical protein
MTAKRDSLPDRRTSDLANDLMLAGFFIVSMDVRAGRRTPEWALAHVEKSIPNRNEHGRIAARTLLTKWTEGQG